MLLSAGALAQEGNANAGSGLSPGASATGNDRSAGVNDGNDRRPGSDGTRRSLRQGVNGARRFAPHRRRHR
ncbi:hypothetical protein [Methylobacterium sp. Leaf456]|uniref:hypothetical protein n=1 Tax=Methylobacterium sp. Leaf456 TaxID=1736382 RepID=UPI0009E71D3E|nr:hypothetical protein [Methylobacterium sp. Leaf456]